MKLTIIIISLLISVNLYAGDNRTCPYKKEISKECSPIILERPNLEDIFFEDSLLEQKSIDKWLNDFFARKYPGIITYMQGKRILNRFQKETRSLQYRLLNKNDYMFAENQTYNILKDLNNISKYIPSTKRGDIATESLITTLRVALDKNVYKNSKIRTLYTPLTGEGFDIEMEIIIDGKPYSLVLIIEEKEKRIPIFKKK